MDIHQLLSGFGSKTQATNASVPANNTTFASNQPLADLTQPADTFQRVNASTTTSNNVTPDQTGTGPANPLDPSQPDPNQQNDDGETSKEVEHHVLKHFTDASGSGRDPSGMNDYLGDVAKIFADVPKS